MPHNYKYYLTQDSKLKDYVDKNEYNIYLDLLNDNILDITINNGIADIVITFNNLPNIILEKKEINASFLFFPIHIQDNKLWVKKIPIAKGIGLTKINDINDFKFLKILLEIDFKIELICDTDSAKHPKERLLIAGYCKNNDVDLLASNLELYKKDGNNKLINNYRIVEYEYKNDLIYIYIT
jgi:hypothetical protein